MVTRETISDALASIGVEPGPGGRAATRLARLAEMLGGEAIELGFIGPRESDRILDRHVLESVALHRFVTPGSSWVDVGSGAGLPGLAIASVVESPGMLIESNARRCAFLRKALAELELAHVTVVEGRAEDFGRGELRESFDVAVARALAPPAVSLELLLPLLAVGGRAVVAVGPSVDKEIPSAGVAASMLGGAEPELTRLLVPGSDAPRLALSVRKARRTPERYPRRAGVPHRRPLAGGEPHPSRGPRAADRGGDER